MKNYCLKAGSKYSADHVNKLSDHIPDLICLTDDPSNVSCETLEFPDLPLSKVWWKMLMFNEELFPSGRFFDLDLIFKKPIDDDMFKSSGKMTLLKTDWEDLKQLNVNTIGDRYKYCSINSSVMAWNGNTHRIWNDFIQNHEKIMFLFNGIDTYLEHRWMDELDFFETGLVSSYRCDPDADCYIMSYDGEDKARFFSALGMTPCIPNMTVVKAYIDD